MRLTVIGNNGAVPRPGGACSAYLVEDLGKKILLDCGTGAYSRLQQKLNPFDLDAVIISHFHADHFFDLVPFRYALIYALRGRRETPLPLWLPPGGKEQLSTFARSFGAPADFFAGVFALGEFGGHSQVEIGDVRLVFTPTQHYIPSYSIQLRGSATLTYSGDTALCDEAVSAATGADLLLCEATAQASTYDQTRAGHLSAADAATVATRAGVRRLLLTHIWHELDPAISLREARATFAGDVEVAVEGATYEVLPGERPGE